MTTEATEQRLHELLDSLGYEATDYVSETGVIWRNLAAMRHLVVPNAADGWYPSWMLDDLVERARRVGDQAAADAIRLIRGD